MSTAITRSSHGGRFQRFTQQVEERRRRTVARREHAEIMRDPRLVAEHLATATHADSVGEPGCQFCG
jgi:hypothetical protein